MRPVPLQDFRVPTRRLAAMMWGEVNATYRCNRRGVSYYSCSGHGGYVVDSRALTAKERRKIDQYKRPLPLNLLIQHWPDGDKVVGVNANWFTCGRPRRYFRYFPNAYPVEWQELPVYVFEEDCDWAILEHLTDIYDDGHIIINKRKRKAAARQCFNQWAKRIEGNNE